MAARKPPSNPFMSTYRSKETIKCGHCGVKIRRDRLKEHTREQHPGCSKLEKGEVQSRSLVDMLREKNKPNELEIGKKRKSDQQEGSCKRQKRDDGVHEVTDAIMETDNNESRPSANLGPGSSTTTAQTNTVPKAASASTTADRPAPVSTAIKPTCSASEASGVSAKLDEVLLKLSKLEMKTNYGPPMKDTEIMDYAKETEALQVLIQASKSIRRLCDLAGLTPDEDRNTLNCDVCCADGSIKSRAGSGIFNYDFSCGIDFIKSHQPISFSNLKRSVARHIGNQAHVNNVQAQNEENEKLQKLRKHEESVGVTLGKQAYKLLKLGRPFSDYEIDLKLMADANVKIGNLNHSRKFPSELRPCFADVTDLRIREYISNSLPATGTKPPIGIVSDKMTARRRTGQMHAAILFTPGMDSLMSPVSLGVTPVKKHDGEAIAEDIANVCKQYSIDNDQLAGFGFDGQYFNLGVPNKLRDKLHLDQNVAFTWDPAHLLQLADKDARKLCPWIDETCRDIAAILSKFSFGKTFEEAIDKAAALGIDFKAPRWFSETRFAAYAHGVFGNFVENYHVIRQVLEQVAASDDQRAPDMCNLLRRVRRLDCCKAADVL